MSLISLLNLPENLLSRRGGEGFFLDLIAAKSNSPFSFKNGCLSLASSNNIIPNDQTTLRDEILMFKY
jgi:hypothetical protein